MSTPHTPESQPGAQPGAQPQQPQPTYAQQQGYAQQQAQQQAQQHAMQQAQAPQAQAQAQQQSSYAQQQAQQQAYGQQPARPAQQAQVTTLGGTNTFAFLAIIFAFISPLAGIIFGHMGLSQIKRNGDAGRGIGLTGLIISYASFVLIGLFIFAYAFMIIAMIGTMGAAFDDYTLS